MVRYKITIKPETLEKIRTIGESRHKIHKDQMSSRPLSRDYETIGLLGEYTFSRFFSIKPDWSLKINGDERVDFYTKAGTIDIKSAIKAINLFREKDKEHAEILVLAEVSKDLLSVELLGWEYDLEMINQHYKDFGYGIINHYKHYADLRKMDELEKLL